MLGLVTGFNKYGPGDGLAGIDTTATALLVWVDQYCAKNPLDNLAVAGDKLVAELHSRRKNSRFVVALPDRLTGMLRYLNGTAPRHDSGDIRQKTPPFSVLITYGLRRDAASY